MTADALPATGTARHRRAALPQPSSGRARGGHRRSGGDRRSGGERRSGGGIARPVAFGGRLIICITLSALALAAYKENFLIRSFEAGLASHVLALGASVPAGHFANTAIVWFAASPAEQIGLSITPECTVALLMIPFLLATAGLVWLKTPMRWPVTALAASLALLIALNQLRILTIAWFVLGMGDRSGFYWGHTMVGSLITVLGVAATLVLYTFLAIRRGNVRRTR